MIQRILFSICHDFVPNLGPEQSLLVQCSVKFRKEALFAIFFEVTDYFQTGLFLYITIFKF